MFGGPVNNSKPNRGGRRGLRHMPAGGAQFEPNPANWARMASRSWRNSASGLVRRSRSGAGGQFEANSGGAG